MPTLTEKEIRAMAEEWGQIMTAIGPHVEAAEKLKQRIYAWLKTTNRVVKIQGKIATAERYAKFGDRECPVEKFLEATKESDEADVRECLKVELKKAEKLIGKDLLDSISHRPTVRTNTIYLNERGD